jgi:hypothetical protein
MAPYLMTNLASERTEAKHSEEIASDDVRRAVNRTIHMLKNATGATPRPFILLDFSTWSSTTKNL